MDRLRTLPRSISAPPFVVPVVGADGFRFNTMMDRDAHRLGAGLGLVATDLDWSHGTGPEVSGPGLALVMAMTGRPRSLDALSGDGVDTLRDRVVAAR